MGVVLWVRCAKGAYEVRVSPNGRKMDVHFVDKSELPT